MISSCQRYVISYNGEVFNFQELREQLRHLGHSFNGGSDTEVILTAIVEWGVNKGYLEPVKPVQLRHFARALYPPPLRNRFLKSER